MAWTTNTFPRAAAAFFAEALEYEPNFHEARFHRARMLVEANQLSAASAEYRKLLETDPAEGYHERAHWGQAIARLRLGDEGAAMRALERSLKVNPNYPEALHTTARLLLRRLSLSDEDQRKALDCAERAVAQAPSPPASFHATLSECYELEERWDEALVEIEKALSLLEKGATIQGETETTSKQKAGWEQRRTRIERRTSNVGH